MYTGEACEIRPWMFPTGWPDLMFRAYHLRAALLPYLCVPGLLRAQPCAASDHRVLIACVGCNRYTAAWKSTKTGVLTMHPLYYEYPEEEEAYTSSRFAFDDDPKTNKLNVVSRPLQYLFGPDLMVAPVQTPATIGVEPPPPALPALRAAKVADGANFTLYKGQWCGQGTCMHASPIGGIQPAPSYEVCEARCKAAAPTPCLSFDFQSGKCESLARARSLLPAVAGMCPCFKSAFSLFWTGYQWPCYALKPAPNQDKTTVCGNRSNVGPPPPPGPPSPPPPTGPPTPPPAPPRPLPPPKKAVGIAVQDVWMPPGDWIHWQSGKHFQGPQLYRDQRFALDDIALYARLGAVVPLKDATESAHLAPNKLIFAVLAGAAAESNGSCQVYEDDGESTGYLPGAKEYSLLEVTARTVEESATVYVKPAKTKQYDGAPTEREYAVEYRNNGAEPSRVLVNGVAVIKQATGVGWSMRAPCTEVTCTYDAPAVVVRTAKMAASDEVTVKLEFK